MKASRIYEDKISAAEWTIILNKRAHSLSKSTRVVEGSYVDYSNTVPV